VSNPVWSWFKKAAHYVKVGVTDATKFLQTSGALNLISLFPAGGLVAKGIGIFETALGATSEAEQAAAIFAPGVSGTGPQKLLMATPDVEQALIQFATAAGFKITNPAKANTIASTIGSAAADFWNILEPVNNPGLPTPATSAAPATTTAAPQAKTA
jgi:hypothetical protein